MLINVCHDTSGFPVIEKLDCCMESWAGLIGTFVKEVNGLSRCVHSPEYECRLT